MDYVIIVNDNGELKTISATEFEKGMTDKQKNALAGLLENVLDARSQLAEMDRIARDRSNYDLANETVDAKTRS